MQQNRDEKSKLVVWKCPKGHPTTSGFLLPGEHSLRFCAQITGVDTRCMVPLEVVLDERPKAERNAEQIDEAEKKRRIANGIKEAQKNLCDCIMTADQIVRTLGVALKGIRKERT